MNYLETYYMNKKIGIFDEGYFKKIIWILIKKYILFKETRILGIQTFIFFLLTCFRWNIVQTRIRLKLKDEDTIEWKKLCMTKYTQKEIH